MAKAILPNVDFTFDAVESEHYKEGGPGNYPREDVIFWVVVTGLEDENVTNLTINREYSTSQIPNNPRWQTTYYYTYYVVGIADNAFDGNTTLKKVNVRLWPYDGYGLGTSPFSSCTALEEVSIEAPNIPGSTFWNCTNLKKVTLQEGVKSIGYQAFYNTAIESITLPSTVDLLGMRAFENCSQLKDVTFNNCAIKEIPASLFSNCQALTKLTLPEGVTTLQPTIASGGNMSYIKLPSTIREIGTSMVMTKTPLTLECGVFDPADITLEPLVFWFNGDDFNFASQCTLIVPPGTKELYKEAKQWKSFGTIIEKTYLQNFCGTPYVDVFDLAYMHYEYASGALSYDYDINQDGIVDDADFTALQGVIFNAVYPPCSSFYPDNMLKTSVLPGKDINNNDVSGGATIDFDLSTDQQISAVQFDLRLPEGAYVYRTWGSDENYVTSYQRISNDIFRVIAIPLSNNGYCDYNTLTGDAKLVKVGIRGLGDDY